jgi:hypothetical protein
MTDEDSAGASYLASLRQSTAPQAAASAPARAGPRVHGTQAGVAAPLIKNASIQNAAIQKKSGPPDKRKSPRYKCNGSARIQEIGSATSTWATFADISMHGCYVETATPLRSGTRLSLKLDANGIRVEATGEVRVVYPGLGMGVFFTAISDEARERLHEVVRSLAPASVIVTSRVAPRNSPLPATDARGAVANPGAVVQAIQNFFKDRHVMGREEFLKILRKGL